MSRAPDPLDGFGGNLDAAFDAPGAKCDGGTCGLGGYCSKCPKQMTAPAVPNLVESHLIGTAPAVQPLTDEQISHFWDIHVGMPTAARPLNYNDVRIFARAIERAHGIEAQGSADHG